MAPEHGEHTEEILLEIGRTPEDLAKLRDKGIVA
jgi:crotonobetainyl-CoA:carnitine CoA-transferase CaiB-like acyl-CoA transferase